MKAQQIRFCTSYDGVRIAYATMGSGPPFVKAANWLTHLDVERDSPVWQHWLRALSRDHTLVRYDERGSGLSDWDAETLTIDAWVHDIETGWGRDTPAFRQVFATLLVPDATPEQMRWFDELQRQTTTPQNAARLESALYEVDVSDRARQVTVPALVLHRRQDAAIPFADLTDRERDVLDLIARGLTNAAIAERLVLSSKTVRNHISRIYSKLDVDHRGQAIVLAREAGLGRDQPPTP